MTNGRKGFMKCQLKNILNMKFMTLLLIVCVLSFANTAYATNANIWTAVRMHALSNTVTQTAKPLTKKQKMSKLYKSIKKRDKKFDKMSKSKRARFIRDCVKYWEWKLKVKKSRRVSGNKSVGISISETSLGKAGVGRSRNNLFGLKLNDKGKYVASYPRYKHHRTSVKALVLFYKQGKEWRLWKHKTSKLGR